MQDGFVAVLLAGVALYSLEPKVATALAAVLGVSLRLSSLRWLKKAKAIETETPLEDPNPGQ